MTRVQRFHKLITQSQSDVISVRKNRVIFYKIDRILSTFPSSPISTKPNITRIALSHIPLLYSPSKFVDYAIETIMPMVIFSGHIRENLVIDSLYIAQEDRKTAEMDPDNNAIFRVSLNLHRMFEFIVPTCAYWNGVDYMGYGAAVLSSYLL